MQTTEKRVSPAGSRQAFTLIELMVVVAIIGILIGGIFQLLSTAGQMNQKAETIARLQRLQNALSGFYAEYGTYPPVPHYQSPDPWAAGIKDDFGQALSGSISTEDGFAAACTFVVQSQPVSFEYPNAVGMNKYINDMYKQWQIRNANEVLGPNAASIKTDDWGNNKMFKFGLLSFLLPRLEQIGFTGTSNNSTLEPDINFYDSRQWKANNPVSNLTDLRKSLSAQQITENRAAARWLPNLEKIVYNGHLILGVNTCAPNSLASTGFRTFEVRTSKGALIKKLGYGDEGNQYVLQYVTVKDGWDKDLYYYSAPPYQSYCIWSAGKDGRTFPPWIPISTLTGNERKWASDWTKDDIVRFDH